MDEVRLGTRILHPRRQLLAGGERVPLGKRALDILSVLAEAKGHIVTKDELLEAVWPDIVVEENALQVHVTSLRKALGPEGGRLKTIRGVGYQLTIDGETAGPHAATPRVSGPRVPWRKLRRFRPALIAAALLAGLLGVWWFAGPQLGLRPHDRIAVVVRALTATTNGDPTEAALARGVTDELIIRLRRIPDLRVAMADPDGSGAGEAFRSAYVVDGGIRRSGDRLRVTARLSSAAGEVLWSQTFDRPLADLLDVQETIAAAIAEALSVSFDVGVNATDYGGTDNPEAYAAYLQYLAHILDPDQRVPQRYLERALALDPNYIKALNQLAVSYGLQANSAPTRREALALMDRFDEITAQAVATNPDLWIGHVARGYYYSNRRDFAAADRSFRRAAELDDGLDPELRAQLAAWALNMGRTEQAAAISASITLIDPARRHDGNIWLLYQQGRLREAIADYERQAARDPSVREVPSLFVFWSYVLLGREGDAIAYFERAAPGFGEGYTAQKAEVQKLAAIRSLAELRAWAVGRFGEGGLGNLTLMALVASHEGHPKLAIDLIRLALERPAGAFPVTVLWTPPMAPTRKTDEFEKLVTDLGLVKLWRDGGDWPDACRPVSEREISCS